MPNAKSRKARYNKLGYGALALYAAGMVAMVLGVYGVNVTGVIMGQSRSERARAEVQSGQIVVSTEDRVQCRSYRFDNTTSQLTAETLADCGDRLRSGTRSSGGSFSIFRDGFVNR